MEVKEPVKCTLTQSDSLKTVYENVNLIVRGFPSIYLNEIDARSMQRQSQRHSKVQVRWTSPQAPWLQVYEKERLIKVSGASGQR